MATTTTKTMPSGSLLEPVPPLVEGARLTRAEFERRYDAMPEVKKAELIEEIVYMGSPVSHDQHGEPHSELMGLLFVYRAATPGVASSDNATVKLDPDNMPQPDCLLFIKPEFGGQAHVDDKGYIAGGPEFVAEVAASSVKLDLGDKFKVYCRSGIREYLVWRVADARIEWYVLRDGNYVALAPGPDGILRSEAFPGLWLDPQAMVKGDLATVLKVLGRGIETPEHAQFAASLKTLTRS